MKKLKVYKLTVDESDTADTGITTISFVSLPAIERDFVYMSKHQEQPNILKFAIQNEDRRIVTGPVMIPNLNIYRRNKETQEEYYITADRDEIEKMENKFIRQGRFINVNTEHSGLLLSGVNMINCFIADRTLGINPPSQFSDLEDGTWFISYKILNDDLWNEVKAGTFSGFSIEAYLNQSLVEMSKVETPSDKIFDLLLNMSLK